MFDRVNFEANINAFNVNDLKRQKLKNQDMHSVMQTNVNTLSEPQAVKNSQYQNCRR